MTPPRLSSSRIQACLVGGFGWVAGWRKIRTKNAMLKSRALEMANATPNYILLILNYLPEIIYCIHRLYQKLRAMQLPIPPIYDGAVSIFTALACKQCG